MQCSAPPVASRNLQGECGLDSRQKNGGYYGLWTRRFAVADWCAAADHYFVGAVLAPLTGK